MFQDSNNGSIPGKGLPEVKEIGTKAAMKTAHKAVDAAVAKANDKTKKVKDKAKKIAQTGGQVMAYASMAQQAGAAIMNHRTQGATPGIAGNESMFAPAGISNAVAIAASQVLGVSHLTLLKIMVEGNAIKHYKHFHLSQCATSHHHFSLTLGHDSLGGPEDHQMETAQKLLGKRITVTFTFKNITGGPERDFIGVITEVGFSREHGNHGNIVLKGKSPTILLDAAPHIQSFGGAAPTKLAAIAHSVLKEGLDSSKYPYRIEPAFEGDLSYSCQYNETHYNYLARTAEAYGEQFFYDGKTLHFGKLPTPEKPISLTFGKEVDEVQVQMKTRHVNRTYYGYNSKEDKPLTAGQTKIMHQSSLARSAYGISEATFTTPSLKIAPIKAATDKDVEAAQKSTSGSMAVSVFTTSGRTSVPFLYPGCVIDMHMRKAGSVQSSYFTKLMVTSVSHTVDALGNYAGYFEAIGADTGFMPMPEHHMPIAEPQMAKVTSNNDSQGRVQVKFDWQPDGTTTEFIRVATINAGNSGDVPKNRGLVFIPEVDDQVMIGFVHNHPDRPFVMHSMFTGQTGKGGESENNKKTIITKSRVSITFDDGPGSLTLNDKGNEKIELDGNGNISVCAESSISLNCGNASITLKSDGTITIAGVNITSTGSASVLTESGAASVTLTAQGNTAVIDGTDTTLSGTANATVTSVTTSINGDSATNVSSSGSVSVQGAIVKLN